MGFQVQFREIDTDLPDWTARIGILFKYESTGEKIPHYFPLFYASL
jgi:hypothetical protein